MSSNRQHLHDGPLTRSGKGEHPFSEQDIREWVAQHQAIKRPPLMRALARDALTYAFHRGEAAKVRTRLGRITYALTLPFRASEYFALVLYRLRMVLTGAHVPLLPSLMNWACVIGWGIRIDNQTIVDEGVYIAHGEMFIGGLTYIGKFCFLGPYISIGLVQGDGRGPYLEDSVFVGTGARILGPLRVGAGAKIGANAVVLSDVPPGTTAVGAPARVIAHADAPEPAGPEETECAPS